MSVLNSYNKNREFLICIDSDGCAMDTMDCKHFHCFGPCMVDEWELKEWTEPILAHWNQVNLYSMTRGINRFLALGKVLLHVDGTYRKIPQVQAFVSWTETAPELSNASVKAAFAQNGQEIFQKALAWSEAVNLAITKLPEEMKKPFDKAADGIKTAHGAADVAIVSSANYEAVREEWEKFGLMGSVDICLTQSEGSKAFCIGEMLKKGYDKDHVLMVGDAPGDKAAAEKNGVLYYPILVKKDAASWERFVKEALPKFLEGAYKGDYQEQVNQEFLDNLS